MTIGEFQTWTREHEERMGWNQLTRVQLLAHLFEEAGELAQSVNRCYEYRDDTQETHQQNIKVEIVDVLWFVFKIANRFGVDAEHELSSFVGKADSWTVDRHGEKLSNAMEALQTEITTRSRGRGVKKLIESKFRSHIENRS